MNNKINCSETVQLILNNTDSELYAISQIKYCNGTDMITESDMTTEWKGFCVYITANNISVYSSNSSYQIEELLNAAMAGEIKKVKVSISSNAYAVDMHTECGYYAFSPYVFRHILYYLRLLRIKIEIEKKPKNIMSLYHRFITELTLNGKTDISIPELDFLKKPFGKIKTGRKLSIYTDDDLILDKDDQYNEATTRFRGAEWFQSAQNSVTLVGCGGIGSNVAVSLCRVMGGYSLYLYDSDIVEHKNLAGQNFGVSDIGKSKTSVVEENCMNLNPLLKVLPNGRFTESSDCNTNIVITGLDNMASRSLVYYKWKGVCDTGLLIDARLSAEKWQILAVDRTNEKAIEEYESKWLFSDEEADTDVCSYKQTAYAAQMIASFVTNIYINYCSNRDKSISDPLCRYVPFLTEYDASQMIFRTKEI